MYEFKDHTRAVNAAIPKAGAGHGYDAAEQRPIIAVNTDRLNTAETMTVVCSGAARGGSSIVPYLLNQMGLSMGALSGEQHEDASFQLARQNIARLDVLIKERNAASDRWGFKLPALKRGQLKYFDMVLRNPVHVFIFRNPLLTAHSIVSHSENETFAETRAGLANALDSCLQSYAEFIAFMRQTDSPCILISMEYLRASAEECVRYLDQALNLGADDTLLQELAESLQTSGYKNPKMSG